MNPTNGHLYIKPHPTETLSNGGIILPFGRKTQMKGGEVIAVAADIEDISVGDNVLYFSNREREIDGQEYRAVSYESVTCKI